MPINVLRRVSSGFPGAILRGAGFDGKHLYLFSAGSNPYRILDIDGKVLEVRDPVFGDSSYGTPVGRRLWILDEIAPRLYLMDNDTGRLIRNLGQPAGTSGALRGMTLMGKYILISNTTGQVFWVDHESNRAVRTITPAGLPSNVHGIAFDGKYIWLGSTSARVFKVDPQTGIVLESISLPAAFSSSGIVAGFDGRYLWISDHPQSDIYQCSIA